MCVEPLPDAGVHPTIRGNNGDPALLGSATPPLLNDSAIDSDPFPSFARGISQWYYHYAACEASTAAQIRWNIRAVGFAGWTIAGHDNTTSRMGSGSAEMVTAERYIAWRSRSSRMITHCSVA